METDKAQDGISSLLTDEFNAEMRHDFCNAMMTILGHVDMARTRIQTGQDGSLEHLAEIEAAARRTIDMCRQLSRARPQVFPLADTVVSGGSDEVSELTLSGGRILLVDDEASVRAVARQMLERIGFHVESAVDGGDALEILEHNPHRFSCVLLDISMPGMSGDVCFSKIRNLYPALPIMFSSGSGEISVVESLVESPLTTFIQKPYSINSLRRELHALLRASAPD